MKKGKAIYEPVGKAGEYAKYACNFYVGCSNDCDYCYCKRGVLSHTMGKPQATLKKCFRNILHAMNVFQDELSANLIELQKHGLFFTFTSDPMIPECFSLTIHAVDWAITHKVPCKILTKCGDFIPSLPSRWIDKQETRKYLAFGFTLTGHDEMEPGASTNAERIATMKKLNEMGFKTFASIEPVISIEASKRMIMDSLYACDLYKIGLMSGKREYTKDEVREFMQFVNEALLNCSYSPKVYWKDSVLEYIGETRNDFPLTSGNNSITVNADYDLFNTNRRG